MSRKVADHLSATCGVADMDRLLEVEVLYYSGQVVSIVIHIVTIRDLSRSPMPTTVVGNNAIPMLQKEQHLSVPVIRRQRPTMTENYRLARTPILVEDVDSIGTFYCRHVESSIANFFITVASPPPTDL
jgi:hypothetical protein